MSGFNASHCATCSGVASRSCAGDLLYGTGPVHEGKCTTLSPSSLISIISPAVPSGIFSSARVHVTSAPTELCAESMWRAQRLRARCEADLRIRNHFVRNGLHHQRRQMRRHLRPQPRLCCFYGCRSGFLHACRLLRVRHGAAATGLMPRGCCHGATACGAGFGCGVGLRSKQATDAWVG